MNILIDKNKTEEKQPILQCNILQDVGFISYFVFFW